MSRSLNSLEKKVAQYRHSLVTLEGAVPQQLEDRKARFAKVGRQALSNHLLWMCDRILVALDEDKVATAWRWLGFVECGIYVLDVVAIDDMRGDTDDNLAAEDLASVEGPTLA